MKFEVQRFRFDQDEALWNDFIEKSKNATFLFNRNFMDYHKERFNDHSLLIFNNKHNLVACLPANEVKNKLISHAGLTYGSLILAKEVKLSSVLGIFHSILEYLNRITIEKITLKIIPRIYHKLPADEIEYCLFLTEAKLIRRDSALVIDSENRIKYSGNIRREGNKAEKDQVVIQEEQQFDDFWNEVLIPGLNNRHGVKPVHSLKEIMYLKERFPENIKLFTARKNNKIHAGSVFFEMDNVAHCQYIAANEGGRKHGSLNYLFMRLIDEIYQNKRYFDFGISNENEGRSINPGLLAWKERMGGRTISHDFYEIETKNFPLLDPVIDSL